MKHSPFIRFLALLLGSLILLSAVSCATEQELPNETVGDSAPVTEEEKETAYVPNIQKTNYDSDFNIVIGGTFDANHIFVEEYDASEPMSVAVYEHSSNIKNHLGVTMKLQDAGSWTEYAGNVTKTVQAGDDDYQLVLTPVYQGVTDLITNNVLYDFSEFDSVNLEAPYWATDLMEEIKVEDKYLLGYNDFCLSQVHCLVFNKELREDFRVDDPYPLVRNKQWTLDKLISMASTVAVDDGNNIWGPEDTYGITGWGWVYLISLITSSDLKIVDRDADGLYKIAYENETEKMLDLIDKIYGMYYDNYSYFWKSVPADGTTISFADGTSLFQFFNSVSLPSLREADIRFGVLPYPLYDEKQENYRTLNWNGLMAVPNSIENPQMVGDVLEMLTYYTEPVKVAFYENLLGAKIADAPEDVEMLNIIWDTQVSDVGIITCNSSQQMDNLVYMIPKMCEQNNNNFASYVQKNRKGAQLRLDRVFKQE